MKIQTISRNLFNYIIMYCANCNIVYSKVFVNCTNTVKKQKIYARNFIGEYFCKRNLICKFESTHYL